MGYSRRVLFPFVGDTVGGSHLAALQLIDGLKVQKYESIICVHEEGLLSEYLIKHNYNFIVLPQLDISFSWGGGPFKHIFKKMICIRSFRLFLKKNCIDIVHTNDRRMHILWSNICRFSLSKLVWHQRTIAKGKWTGFHKYADSLITISLFCKQNLEPPMDRLFRIIVDPLFDTKCNYNLEKKEHEVIQIGWVANWIERKNPELFIEVANLLINKRNKKILFFMFGEQREPCRTSVYNLIEKYKLVPYFQLKGLVSPIDTWMSDMDILVVTAEKEGMGRTLIEAMLLRTPVIASDHGGHKEVITNYEDGLLVTPGKAEEFADAIEWIIENDEKTKKMVEKANLTAKKCYSIERHTHEVIEIYESLY
jgi:glycosyltransferase involved in cell wall biosynthesis